MALYFFQSENLKEGVNESTYAEVDPYGITSKKKKEKCIIVRKM